jgi:aldehyde dehydrogenase (NAD+)
MTLQVDAADTREPALEELAALRERQRGFFRSGATREAEFRRGALLLLRSAIVKEEEALLEALAADLGKSTTEAYSNEIGLVYSEIRHAVRHLSAWMKPRKVRPEFHLMPGSARILPEPYGTVLIIAPWNYPMQLLFSPLVGAIAAGNTAILKPSELAPCTAGVIQRIIESSFEPEYLAVVQGGPQVASGLIDLNLDYLFFTGSVPVGKKIMEAASRHLTPLTLELGGKSPAIVHASANLATAARRIAFGKFNNAGQTCVAPDYVLVDRRVEPEFSAQLKTAIREFYGDDPASSGRYGKIVSPRHFDRLLSFLGEGSILSGGRHDRDRLYLEPTVLADIGWNSRIMQDEIFGPILPVIAYDSLEDALDRVHSLPKPLALYVFARDRPTIRHITTRIPFGGGGVNTTLFHVASHRLPFGGVGPSGMGSYHGKASFDTFTHEKSLLHQSAFLDPGIAYPHRVPDLSLLRRILK